MRKKLCKCQIGLDFDMIEKINEFRDERNINTFSKSVREIVKYGLISLELKKIESNIFRNNFDN